MTDRQTDAQTRAEIGGRVNKRLGMINTVVEGADLDGGRAGALAALRLGRQSDVVDGVGREVGEQVRVARRRDGHVHVLAEVRVVVVELVRVDELVGRQLRRVPRQLDGVRRSRLALQVGRLLRNCTNSNYRDVEVVL